ncbi:ABC transporter substrate-binding protein [Candidatus Woesearchaeota archaeon]|nr:ABC transporter substrate-binding protein [Candidatus Woesearchaeota archaeon]
MRNTNHLRNIFFVVFAALVVIIASLVLLEIKGTTSSTSSENKLTKVAFRIGWLPSIMYAPHLLAQEKGFYEEEGLDVEILSSQGSSLAAKLIANGENEFGMASANAVLIGITKGMPLKVIVVLDQETATSALYFDANIEDPKDFEGKTIASDPKSTKRQEFTAFAEKNGIDLDKVKFLPASGSSQELQALMNGDADIALSYFYYGPIIIENKGFENLNVLKFSDYGLDIYGQTLIANENLIKENPDLVRKFVRASVKGWEYSLNNPEEAADVLVKRYPEMDKDEELEKFKAMLPIFENADTQEHGFGYQSRERWEEMQDSLLELGLIDKKTDTGKLFSNDFLQ